MLDDLQHLAGGAVLTFGGRAGGVAIKYATQLVFARLLGVAGYGLLTLALGVYEICTMLAQAGFQDGTVRFVSKSLAEEDPPRLKGVLVESVAVPGALGLIIGALVFLGADPVSRAFTASDDLVPALRVLAVGIPFGAVLFVGAFATTGFHVPTYKILVADLFQPLVNLALGTALVVAGFGVTGAAFAWTVSLVGGSGLIALALRKLWRVGGQPGVAARFDVTGSLRFSAPLVVTALSWTLLLWTDALLVGVFRAEEEVGIYRAASQSALLLTLFLSSFAILFAPLITERYEAGRLERLESLYATVLRWSLMAATPFIIVFLTQGSAVLRIFGETFVAGAPVLAILTLGQMLTILGGNSGFILSMSGHPVHQMIGDLLVTVQNVVLNLLFIPRWGIEGAAAATLLSLGSLAGFRVWQIWRIMGIQPYTRSLIKPLLGGAVALLAVLGAEPWLGRPHFLLGIALTGALASVTYLAAILLLGSDPLDREFFALFTARSEERE